MHLYNLFFMSENSYMFETNERVGEESIRSYSYLYKYL